MKTFTIHTVVKNYSRYPVDIVWDNAKDLEHVAFLHSNTNASFELLYSGRDKNSPFEYDMLVYRAVRKFHFLRFGAFGFRRIIQERQIHQIDHIPRLGITTALNSMLLPNSDPEFPTLMQDEVVMEVPAVLAFMKDRFIAALRRHTAIQCAEDEPFRERRVELRNHKIEIPFSLFNESAWARFTSQFEHGVP